MQPQDNTQHFTADEITFLRGHWCQGRTVSVTRFHNKLLTVLFIDDSSSFHPFHLYWHSSYSCHIALSAGVHRFVWDHPCPYHPWPVQWVDSSEKHFKNVCGDWFLLVPPTSIIRISKRWHSGTSGRVVALPVQKPGFDPACVEFAHPA